VCRPNRGQVATEFFLYVTVFMFIVIAAFIIISHVQSAEVPMQQNRMAKITGEEFANVVTLAVKGGPGFTYNYTFSRTVMGTPYRIYFEPNRSNNIIIEWPGPYGNFSYSYRIPAYNYAYYGCVNNPKRELSSDRCSNKISLSNNGSILTISQLPG
jgi:uncharacterized protein (UPF0333 family)